MNRNSVHFPVSYNHAMNAFQFIAILLCSSNILTPDLNTKVKIETKIKLLSHLIKFSSNSTILLKDSNEFNIARVVHNGLCKTIIPNIIVIPTSTNDVSTIVKIVKRFNFQISIRSGGHSYICSNIKHGKTSIFKCYFTKQIVRMLYI